MDYTDKRRLVDFQKSLNEKFEQIENESQYDLGLEEEKTDDSLGISFPVYDKNFNTELKIFIPLYSLSQIISHANYETFYLSQKWIKGFIHYRGEGYSVIDPAQFLSASNIQKDAETRLAVFKSKDSLRYSFLVRDIVLTNLNDLTHSFEVNTGERLQETVLKELEESKVNNGFEFNYEFFLKNEKIGSLLKNRIKVDAKLLSILKTAYANKDSLSKLTEYNFENKKNYFNLNHYQKYLKVYTALIEEKEKYELDTIKVLCSQKTQNLNILTFSSSFYIDNSQQLVVKIEPNLLNQFLRYISA